MSAGMPSWRRPPSHGLEHPQRHGQRLVPFISRRQVVEGQFGRRRNVPSGPGSHAARPAAAPTADRMFSTVESANAGRMAFSTTPAISCRCGPSSTFQMYSDRAWVGVAQREFQSVDLRAGVEPVQAALLPGEFVHQDDVPGLVRVPRADPDVFAHPHPRS